MSLRPPANQQRWPHSRVCWVIALSLLGIGVIGLGLWRMSEPSPLAPAERLAAARARLRQGDFRAAEALAQPLLVDPANGAAALLVAQCALQRKDATRALHVLQATTTIDRQERLAIAGMTAELCHRRLGRLRDAERAYRQVLDLAPDDVAAHQGLAELLALCGRRREAVPHILRLVQLGVDTELLLYLARIDGVISDPELLKLARASDPADPNPLVGLAWTAWREEQLDDALQLAETALTLEPEFVPAQLLRGEMLVALQRSGEFAEWNQRLPESAEAFSDTWLIRARMSELLDDQPASQRCWWEAWKRGPESKTAATALLRHLDSSVASGAAATLLVEQIRRLQHLEELQTRTLFGGEQGRPEMLFPLARAYESAGRLWEAWGWSRLAAEVGGETPELHSWLDALRLRLHDQPAQLVLDRDNVALRMDFSELPLPRFGTSEKSPAETSPVPPLTFRDDAASAGLDFQYFNGVPGPTTHRMFEFTGGGVGVLDFNLDGFPDVCLTQGTTWPFESAVGAHADQVFLNRRGAVFDNVTPQSRLGDSGFGQGVAVGDIDNDGFPDVYIANIGANALWRNLGDGTFENVTVSAGIAGAAWTTSAVIADLDGDGLPDIYEVNYLQGDDVFERVCRHADGAPRQCLPVDFLGCADRYWRNLGDGRLENVTADVFDPPPDGKGLGVLAGDFSGSGQIELLVANDTTPSFLLTGERDDAGRWRLRDRGIERGIAFNGAGKATGCMGIACGDVNGDGRADVLISNFYMEANTLFLQETEGNFSDATARFGLREPSLPMLGFGTQFFDIDLDGWLDLVVVNGHVDDLTRRNVPYQMRPQLFWNDNGRRFQEIRGDRAGSWFDQPQLGRALARLDWNRDGRDDFVVSNLNAPAALLTNTTTPVGNFLSLRLVGVVTARNAIGATVTVEVGERTLMSTLVAGDGYQASNESKLTFGLGTAAAAQAVQVRWPDGELQQLGPLSAGREYVLVQGRAALPL